MFLRSRPIIVGIIVCLLVILFLLPSRKWIPMVKESGDSTFNENYAVDAVIVQLKDQNVEWMLKYFPEWHHKVYIADDPTAKLAVPKNKGRESMAYLTYIIDNYDELSDYVLFLHSDRFQWHNDDPDYDGYSVLKQLRFQHIHQEGYVSLRCAWSIGCPAEVRPYLDLVTNKNHKVPGKAYKEAFEELFPDIEVPKTIGAACCAQFAVTREAIRTRPKTEYIRYRKWLLETELDDEISGRIFEYSWHMIFGKEPRHCPPANECYCQLFGLCELKCTMSSCEGRYNLPDFADLPRGWPTVDWNGLRRTFNGPP